MMPLGLILGMLALVGAMVAGVGVASQSYVNKGNGRSRLAPMARKDAGAFNVWTLVAITLAIPIVIISLVIIVQIMAALLPTYSSAANNLSTNFTTANWGNSTANSLGPIFGLLIAIAAMAGFLLVGVAVFFALRHHKFGGA